MIERQEMAGDDIGQQYRDGPKPFLSGTWPAPLKQADANVVAERRWVDSSHRASTHI